MRRTVVLIPLLLLLTGCDMLLPKPHYVVFFERKSADLDEPARKTVGEALIWARAHAFQTITIFGYADPTGPAASNNGLAALRAKVVADALTAGGVDPRRVKQLTEGTIEFAADSQESRRAEIVFDGP